MTEPDDIILTQEDAFNRYIPVVTIFFSLACIVLFIGINVEGKPDSWMPYRKWGAPQALDILNGDVWGMVTSSFLHVEIWHIGMNLYWFILFGKKIEFESSRTFSLVLVLTSAWISSCSQMAFSDSTGIGLSGIVYAQFGFLLLKGRTSEQYKYLDSRTINLFMFWLVLCVFLTRSGLWMVGNAAHIGGLLWGLALAFIGRFMKGIQWGLGLLYVSVMTSLIFWSPFSTLYLEKRAYELHLAMQIDEAVKVYRQILDRNPESEFAKLNLKQLELHKLMKKAYDLHAAQRYFEARVAYEKILKIDKDNAWAKENLQMLSGQ
jgi:membrane associated rhomboid family serine protease